MVVTVSDGCSPDTTDTAWITFSPIPVADFSFIGFGCAPVTATFTNESTISQGAIVSWSWDFGDAASGTNNTSDLENPVHIYDTEGTYTVSLTVVSDSGCTDTYTQFGVVTVDGSPTAMFVNIPEFEATLLNSTFSFFDSSSSSVVSWDWNFGDPASGDLNIDSVPYPIHEYTEIGIYTITLNVLTAAGCPATYTSTVEVTEDYVLFAPNAFTPNADGDNDFFMPKGVGIDGEDFEMWIFDRWGDLIATVSGVFGDDPGIGWDGHANNGSNVAQMDVYVWKIRTKDGDQNEHEYVGHVTLLE
ncbi:MAG TPA: PKD domain-containing protein [Flavobacteriales bacterium]|nr:PKD domain-containing protein [Flavobacteriales bacterium]